jgi:undecaprenyl diphosphate synthase
MPVGSVPKSVAVIMDGNGRWATAQGLDRSEGHREGAKRVRAIVTEAAQLGLDALTLYSFSIENWKRPQAEIDVLMELYATYLQSEKPTMLANNIRMRHFGRRRDLPDTVLEKLDDCQHATANNTGMFLCLALNYGSRAEIVDAVQTIATRVAAGELAPDAIDETTISDSLYSVGVPDPDLLVRTSGEMRLSNYLLWQISYAELFVTDVHWPDFTVDEFHKALRAFGQRGRRFGATENQTPQ